MNEAVAAPVIGPGLTRERPFPGLRAFDFEDHAFFFGRDDQIQALYRSLEFSRFVAVVGSSGSGKSSLVRAGLLPLLDKENRGGIGQPWRWVTMRPGTEPLKALATALAEAGEDAADPAERTAVAAHAERLAFALRSSSFGLANVTAELDAFRGAKVVIVVDQFEELFRYAASRGKTGDPRSRARAQDEAAHFVQLLLEASRFPGRALTIVITMRSDFIGDCALFQGLPEAVSAAQFLVPSLTRDQREEVIVRPIEEAGATIDPALVERILNDVSDELDQLPVLQHALKRVWEQSGQDLASGAPRHLSFASYDAVGRAEGALSRHAEEVLALLPGLELAVEQAFRALGEFDRDGRIVRRALPFGQLLAETGVPEDQLRKVIDRFRADDCSFLFPSTDAQPVIDAETGIDVGHEAFLRNWERISADELPGSTPQDPKQGWLREEEDDGRIYKALLAWVETAAPGETVVLPIGQVKERLDWWSARPRTKAWADRYGGGFDSVTRLLADSSTALAVEQADERRAAEEKAEAERTKARNYRRLQAAVGVCILLLIIAFAATGAAIVARQQAEDAALVAEAERAAADAAREAADAARRAAEQAAAAEAVARQQAEEAAADAERSFSIALKSTADLMGVVQKKLEEGTISVGVAREIVDAGIGTLGDLEQTGQSAELTLLRIRLLFAMSDVLFNLDDLPQALKFAENAKTVVESALAGDPENLSLKGMLSAAYTRIGLAHSAMNDRAAALAALKAGWEIDKQLPPADPINLINIADLTSLTDREQALEQYREVLRIREELAAKKPGPVQQQNLAAIHVRLGKLLAKMDRDDEALEEFRTGMKITEALLAADPENTRLMSNLASAVRQVGDFLMSQKNYPEALASYERARDLRHEAAQSDPSNVLSQNWLAQSYLNVGDALVANGRYDEAIAQFSEAVRVWTDLATKHPDKPLWAASAAEARARIGGTHVRLAEAEKAKGDRASAIRQYRVAIAIYTEITPERPENQKSIMDIQVALGDLYVELATWGDAVTAYQAAIAAGDKALAKNFGDDELRARIAELRVRVATLCYVPTAPSACRR